MKAPVDETCLHFLWTTAIKSFKVILTICWSFPSHSCVMPPWVILNSHRFFISRGLHAVPNAHLYDYANTPKGPIELRLVNDGL